MSTTETLTWEDVKRMIAELAVQTRETDRLIRELREQSKETDRRMRRLQQELGRLGNRLGEFVQDMVAPAVVRLFQEQGLGVHRVMMNVVARNDQGVAVMEIDLLVIDGAYAILIECKSRLTTDDIAEHLERLARFKEVFPEYADKQVYGAVAAMSASASVIRHAERAGLYVLVQADDDVVLANRQDFVPRVW